jgi:hypothetical protein
MGWKAAAIFIRAGQPVGIAPMEHDPTRVAPLFAAIALPAHPTGQNETLRTAIDPRRKANYIGCYNNLTVITSWACAEAMFGPAVHPVTAPTASFREHLMRAFPASTILAIILHSVTNLWGIALVENGQPIRTAAGSADDGWIVNDGPPLPEEAPSDRFHLPDDGEELCLAASARVLGHRLDSPDGPDWQQWPVQRFEIERPSLFSRLFSRGA